MQDFIEHPGSIELPSVFICGLILCLGFLVLVEFLCRTLAKKIQRKPSGGLRIFSLLGLIVASSLLCWVVQIRPGGLYPGWRVRIARFQGGAYVDRTGQNYRTIVGGGDPRNGLESCWQSMGRSVVYAGRELVDGQTR